jgi:hypothetical protein
MGHPLRGGTSGVEYRVGPEPGTGGHVFSPDGKLVATCTLSTADLAPYARVWDVATGRPRTPPLAYSKLIHSLAFSPDSRTLAVGTVGPIILWDIKTATGKVLPHTGPEALIRFSPDGRWLAAFTRKGWRGVQPGMQVWDVQNARAVAPLAPLPNAPNDVVFLPDGRSLQTVETEAAMLRRWDAPTGKQIGAGVKFALPPHVIQTVLRRDGSRFLTGTTGGSVQEWDCATGRKVGPAMVHPSPVALLAYSPDGATVVGGYRDGTVRLWDAATARPVGPPLPNAGKLIGVGFDRSGALLTTTDDGTTRAWPVPAPMPEDSALLETWHRATFGIRMEGAETVVLDAEVWEKHHQELRSRWPAGERGGSSLGERIAWHEARARDACQAGNPSVELWHLEQLTSLQPRAWLPCARRGGVHTANGDWKAAGEDYDRAQALAGRAEGELLDWYRHRALTCNRLGQHEAEKWYLDRLLATVKDDWRLLADRADAYRRLGLVKEREADLTQAIHRGGDRAFLLRLADERAGSQQWRPALDLCQRAERKGPLDLGISRRLALLYLKLDDRKGYRRVCTAAVKALQVRPLTGDVVQEVGLLCTLGPGAHDDLGQLAGILEQVLTQIPAENRALRGTFLSILGAVLYRAGQTQAAVNRLQESVPTKGGLRDWAFLTMANRRLGKGEEASKWLTRVRNYKPMRKSSVWLDLDEDLLRREVESQRNEF